MWKEWEQRRKEERVKVWRKLEEIERGREEDGTVLGEKMGRLRESVEDLEKRKAQRKFMRKVVAKRLNWSRQ